MKIGNFISLKPNRLSEPANGGSIRNLAWGAAETTTQYIQLHGKRNAAPQTHSFVSPRNRRCCNPGFKRKKAGR